MNKRFWILATLSLCLCTFCVASEQNENSKQDDDIENIVVYAQKRHQDIKDVSLAVSVLSTETLQQLYLKDTTMLSGQVPNAKITANTGEGSPPVVNIRGVGSLDYNNTTIGPVGFYFDNVTGGSLANSLLYLFDIDSIEVLRGPQGSLFGRNTTGGAVLINSMVPVHDTEGYLTLGVANQSHDKAEGVFNTELNENLALRVGFSHQNYHYSSKNLEPGYAQAGMHQNNYRVLVQHESEGLDVLFKLHAANWQGNVKPVRSKGYIANLETGEFCTAELAGTEACTDNFGFNVGSDDFHSVQLDDDSPHKTERSGGSIEVNVDINPNTSLTSVTSINQLDRLHTFNCDASPAQLCDGDLGVDNQVLTQELRLQQQINQHYLISGLFFIDENIHQDNQIDLFRDFRASIETGPVHYFYDNRLDIRSAAIFSQLDFSLSDSLTLTAGLRYTNETTNYTANADINVPIAPGDFDGTEVNAWDLNGTVSDAEFSGKLALIQQLNPHTNVYYSFNRGFKSGGYNGALAFSANEARLAEYGPEILNAWEIGVKTGKQNYRASAAAFYYDYQNQQVFMNQQSQQALSAPVQVLDNVGESQIYGAEAELSYTLDQQWLLGIGVGYLPRARLKEFINLEGIAIRNNRLPFSSRWNINGLANYQTSIANGELNAQLDFEYQSAFYFDQNQNPLARQSGFTLWNANLSYSVAHWQWILWGKNLTDAEYSIINFDMGPSFGLLQDLKGEARRYGVEMRYQF